MTEAIKINQNDGVTRNVMVGGETTVDFDFPIYADTHIDIYETAIGGSPVLLVKDTDYTVPSGSVEVEAGGTVTLDGVVYPSGATAGNVFTAYLAVPEERTTDFKQAGDYFADTLNTELDLLTQQSQQIRRDISRAVLLAVDTTLTGVVLPPAEASKILGWNSAGDALENHDVADFQGATGATGATGPAGSIDNIASQASATIALDDALIFADTSDSNNSKQHTPQGILNLIPSAGLVDFVSGVIEVAQDQDYLLIIKSPYAGTITEVTTKSSTGTCTATVKVNATALGGTANSVSTSEQSQAHASNNTFVVDDDIAMTISANSSCENVSFTIKFTRTG